ncbi:hypothetical protein OSB04_018397 [Centaurea solstitialis]|uniref:F-box domain-containing protein n=1 Tax=Centaurea solstitialis TaxID=347529 RepID=A0AA38TMU6_9ASTR|nr:hypothetical protein OSB04_018397 [Centaurea solstitialis]
MGLPRQHPTTIGNLPGELLSEILIRVPSKPLARMRSVSKPWNHLLSQPSFIKSHLHRSLHNQEEDETLLVLLSGNYDESCSITAHLSQSPHLQLPDFIEFPNSPPPRDDYSVTFFGSVNGLICYAFRTDHDDYVIQIWNPSLSTVLTLPPFNGPCWFPVDNYNYQLHFRFGYDPKTDDYKLVKLMSYTLPSDLTDYLDGTKVIQPNWYFDNSANDVEEVEVYSMRNGSWKLIESRLPSHVRGIVDEQVVCADGYDGRLHWIGSTVNGNKQTMVTFDLGVEAFGEIPLPNSVVSFNGRRWNGGLGIYSGKLCVMSSHKLNDFEVWVMNEYGVAESWTKLRVFSDFGDVIEPYGFTTTNKFLFSTRSGSGGWLCSDNYDQLNIYDPDADTVKSFGTLRMRIWTKIVRYVESLVWVAPAN